MALMDSPIPTKGLTAVSLVLNWALYSVVLLIILYPFFKESKYAAILKYYGLIVGILSAVFVKTLTLGIVGVDAYSGFNVRTLLMGIEIGMVIAYCFVLFMENDYFKIKLKDLTGLIYIVGMLLATMPGYMLRALFGETPYTGQIKGLTPDHRLVLYISFILPVVLYFLLRKKDKEQIRGVLLYISLGTLLSFSTNNKFMDFANVTAWPIHLCNTAMYIMPIVLIFKISAAFITIVAFFSISSLFFNIFVNFSCISMQIIALFSVLNIKTPFYFNNIK